jgi:hypothetical protein
MKSKITIALVIALLFLNGCAAVRMAGRVSSAAGSAMVQSADEEEAKKANKQRGQSEEATDENSGDIIAIKKRYTSVKVRPDPSTRKQALTTLTGGDKVEFLEENKGWIKIRFNVEGNEGEGWIKKDMTENQHQ